MAAWASVRTGNWSRTSDNADSPWYDGGAQTALARVPGSTGTDSVTITATHTVTYDYDMSAAGTLTGLVINGTLAASTSAGAYYLKMGGTSGQNITFGAAGSFTAGSSGTAYPTNCTFTVDLNGSSGIDCTSGPSGCLAFYCTEPTWPMVQIGAEAAGQTQLDITGWVKADGTVETGKDLTTDPSWAIGRTVYVVHNRIGNTDVEARTIDSVGSNYVTVTAGLTALKAAGSYVALSWRNVRIIGYTSTSGAVRNGAGAVIGCEISSTGVAVYSGVGHQIIRGCIHGGSRCISGGLAHVMSGGVLIAIVGGDSAGFYVTTRSTLSGGFILGCNYGFGSCISPVMTGGRMWCTSLAFSSTTGGVVSGGSMEAGTTGISNAGTLVTGGTITRFTNGVAGYAHELRAGTISGCTYGVYGGGILLRGVTLTGNTYDVRQPQDIRGFGAILASATQVYEYRTLSDTHGRNRCVIWDIGAVAGAVKWWSYGGNGASVATQPTNWPAGVTFSESYQQTFETVDVPCYLDKPIYVRKSVPITVQVYCKMSGTGFTTRGTAELVDCSDAEPIAASPLATATMTDDTNWQVLTLTYTTDRDKQIYLRVRGKNASGTLIWREVVIVGTRTRGMVGGLRG